MAEPTPFGIRLREIRTRRKLNQQQLADVSGVPMMMISHFETGTRPGASAATLQKLADALHVSIDYLLARTDDPVPVSGKMAMLFRSYGSQASEETLQAATTMLEALLKNDVKKADDATKAADLRRSPRDEDSR